MSSGAAVAPWGHGGSRDPQSPSGKEQLRVPSLATPLSPLSLMPRSLPGPFPGAARTVAVPPVSPCFGRHGDTAGSKETPPRCHHLPVSPVSPCPRHAALPRRKRWRGQSLAGAERAFFGMGTPGRGDTGTPGGAWRGPRPFVPVTSHSSPSSSSRTPGTLPRPPELPGDGGDTGGDTGEDGGTEGWTEGNGDGQRDVGMDRGMGNCGAGGGVPHLPPKCHIPPRCVPPAQGAPNLSPPPLSPPHSHIQVQPLTSDVRPSFHSSSSSPHPSPLSPPHLSPVSLPVTFTSPLSPVPPPPSPSHLSTCPLQTPSTSPSACPPAPVPHLSPCPPDVLLHLSLCPL